MTRIRSKPVVFEAFEWKKGALLGNVPQWIRDARDRGEIWVEGGDYSLRVKSRNIVFRVAEGDMIVLGKDGELHVCQKDDLDRDFEVVDG